MFLNKYTMVQLMIAAGLARKLERSEICRITGCTQGYITKLLVKPEFDTLVKAFNILPNDKDTQTYNGLSTIMMEVGRLIYLHGEKLSG